jgi:hypothetical protein
MSTLTGKPITEVIDALSKDLPFDWADAYIMMPGAGTEISVIPLGGYVYLFDHKAERVVVAYGLSSKNSMPRDNNRICEFLKKIAGRFQGRTDKGHIMSHAQGGGLDINLFPQRPDVNRGRRTSQDGVVYRELERYCSSNPGAFCFSRLLYNDTSWVPNEIEYGVLYHAKQFRVERITNAPM